MAGFFGSGLARALCLGLMAVALTACASAPAPISGGWASARPSLPPPPFDPSTPPHVANPRAHLQCVPFARDASGVDIHGDANTWWEQAEGRYPRSSTPATGAVFVMRGYNDPGRGHVAVVTHVDSSRMIRVDHANWLNNGEVSVGVPVLDVSPANDWSEVRVWNIPGQHWGGRVYSALGFIHPFALRLALSS